MEVRLIHDPPADGPWNMSVDEALLATAAGSGRATLRFYEWTPATLSLGYFQAHQQRAEHAASTALASVRRATGGGAIVHDRELTYSFTAPLEDRFLHTEQWVEQFHTSLQQTLRQWGIRAELCGEGVAQEAPPFLCFQRRARLDLLLGPDKIGGSAQRRQRRAGLIHGSILLARSPAAPELPGIAELSGVHLHPQQLAQHWAAEIGAHFGWDLVIASLTDEEHRTADAIRQSRFGHLDWTTRR